MKLDEEIVIVQNEGSDIEERVVVEVPFYYIEPVRQEGVKLDTRAELGLRLFASGTRLSDAAKIAGTRPQKIRKLLETDQGKDTLKKIRLELDEEFKSLYRDSIEVLRQGLKSPDPQIKHKAADTFLKYAKEINLNVVLTAEDLVRVIKQKALEEEKV
jgi:hypothetical protein